jgi:hypothetical protein
MPLDNSYLLCQRIKTAALSRQRGQGNCTRFYHIFQEDIRAPSFTLWREAKQLSAIVGDSVSGFSAAAQAAVGVAGILAQEVPCQFAHDRQVLRRMIFAHSTSVFVEGDIPYPVQTVLYRLVTTRGHGEGSGIDNPL